MKQLIVAEKPSVGRDIARVLGVKNKNDGYLENEEYIVTWALGHLVTLSEPDEIDQRYAHWRMSELPMLPTDIPLKVISKTRSQFSTVKKLMASTDVSGIICATDSGREGELIFRYIYQMAKCTKPVMRLWISSMTDISIKAGLSNMKPSKDYDALYLSARCRSLADWLVGMNASRAFTLKYGALLSIGRVQTPTLALLVKRDNEIAAFVPEDYWVLTADFGDYTGQYIDPETKQARISTKERADSIKKEVTGKTGVITECVREEKRVPPELLYDLTSLQREANRKYGYPADKTLNIAQSLYETRKLITYPRTDSRYLTHDMVDKVAKTLKILGEPFAAFVAEMGKPAVTKRIYDDSKVSDHHAIIPTEKRADNFALTPDVRNIYDIVARRFTAAHMKDNVYTAARILTEVNGHTFKTTGSTPVSEGWKALYRDEKKSEKENESQLPNVSVGDNRTVQKVSLKAQKTKPPSPHTDDTLLKAMEDAGKTIEDEEMREKMKEAGLGTPATRAAIITRLTNVGYAQRRGKQIFSTDKGKLLISVAPEELTVALTTGKWERALTRMAKLTDDNEMHLREQKFMDSIKRYCVYLVDYAQHKAPSVAFPKEDRQKSKPKRTVKKT